MRGALKDIQERPVVTEREIKRMSTAGVRRLDFEEVSIDPAWEIA